MNLDLTNLYTAKSCVKGTTFFNPEIVKYMKKKLDIQPNLSIVNKCTNFASVLGLQYFEVPLYMFICLCFFYVLGIQLMKTEQ